MFFLSHSTGTGINTVFMVELKDVRTWKGDLNEPRYVAVDTKLGVLLNFEIRDSSFEFQVWSFESRVSSQDFLNQCSISIVVVAFLKG